jgi:hypothetical protein
MRYSPLLWFHICFGVAGFVSGAVAVSFRKGSRGHARAGNVFVISMLSLAASGTYLAWVKSEAGNVLGGVLTFYLVATAWMTARRRKPETGAFDWTALLVVGAVTGVIATYGWKAATSRTGLALGYPVGPYIFLGTVACIALAGDARMLVRGGVFRHATHRAASLADVFRVFYRSGFDISGEAAAIPRSAPQDGALLLLSFLPLIVMAVWLVRIRISQAFDSSAVSGSSRPHSLST